MESFKISLFDSFLSGGWVGSNLRSSAKAPLTFCWRNFSLFPEPLLVTEVAMHVDDTFFATVAPTDLLTSFFVMIAPTNALFVPAVRVLGAFFVPSAVRLVFRFTFPFCILMDDVDKVVNLWPHDLVAWVHLLYGEPKSLPSVPLIRWSSVSESLLAYPVKCKVLQ